MKTRRYAGFLAAFLVLAAAARVSPLSLADRRSGQHHPDGDDNTQEIGRKERRSMKYFVFALALASAAQSRSPCPGSCRVPHRWSLRPSSRFRFDRMRRQLSQEGFL